MLVDRAVIYFFTSVPVSALFPLFPEIIPEGSHVFHSKKQFINFPVPFLAISVLASCGSSELDVLPTPIQLEEYMQAGPIMAHLENLNAIADAHGGNRASGTAGYRASLEYVKEMLADVELILTETEFPFRLWYETGEPVLEQMSTEHIVYRLSEDFLGGEWGHPIMLLSSKNFQKYKTINIH